MNYNRIVIIGNGFDLALGLKTKFSDFLVWDFKRAIENYSRTYENDVFWRMKLNSPGLGQALNSRIGKIRALDEMQKIMDACENVLKFSRSNEVERIVLRMVEQGWVDLEMLYYDLLIDAHQRELLESKLDRKYEQMLKVQHLMSYLTKWIEEYIFEVQNSFSLNQNHFSMRDFLIGLTKTAKADLHGKIMVPNNTLLLNFNYTNTLERILNFGQRTEDLENSGVVLVNHIHGQVKDESNQIIFGYGNDSGLDYEKLESENYHELLQHMKSVRYTLSKNYHNLLNFLFERSFDVCVVGHSAGLSDSTLFSTIFNHSNCRAVHLFHRGSKDSFLRLSISASRHFKNKSIYRERMMPFDPDLKIPLVNQ
jgi:hypothetical protein